MAEDVTAAGREVCYDELSPVDSRGNRSHWWDCSVSFNCFCGRETILSEEDYPRKCDCGREWQLKTTLVVKNEPATGEELA